MRTKSPQAQKPRVKMRTKSPQAQKTRVKMRTKCSPGSTTPGQFSPPSGRDSQVVCSPYREGPPKRSKRYPNCLPGSAQSRSVHLVQGGFRVNFPRPMKVSRLPPRVGPEAVEYQVSFIKYLVSSIKCQVSSIKVSSIKPATNQPKIGFYSREGVYGY